MKERCARPFVVCVAVTWRLLLLGDDDVRLGGAWAWWGKKKVKRHLLCHTHNHNHSPLPLPLLLQRQDGGLGRPGARARRPIRNKSRAHKSSTPSISRQHTRDHDDHHHDDEGPRAPSPGQPLLVRPAGTSLPCPFFAHGHGGGNKTARGDGGRVIVEDAGGRRDGYVGTEERKWRREGGLWRRKRGTSKGKAACLLCNTRGTMGKGFRRRSTKRA